MSTWSNSPEIAMAHEASEETEYEELEYAYYQQKALESQIATEINPFLKAALQRQLAAIQSKYAGHI